MTFWSLTNSDFPTIQTFHQFHDLNTELDLHRLWVVSMEHLQRVRHASRERLPFRTPGSIPHCGTCLCSNCWDQIPRTCHVFTRLFTSNTPWYFLDFSLGSGDRFLVHTGIVHGGFAVLLRTSCYEFVMMILYCINMLDMTCMKYACCRVDMCCVGWGWIWGKWRHQCPYLGLTKSRMVFVQER